MFGVTTAAATLDIFRPRVCEGSMIANLTRGIQSMGGVIAESGEEEVPLAVLSRQLKKKVSKQVNAFRLSGECCPNLIPPSRQDKIGWFLPRKGCSKGLGLKYLLLDLTIRHKFYCMMCKVIVSMPSSGVYGIKRHYQSVGYLRKG